jgi:S1-C subfamily serine protease
MPPCLTPTGSRLSSLAMRLGFSPALTESVNKGSVPLFFGLRVSRWVSLALSLCVLGARAAHGQLGALPTALHACVPILLPVYTDSAGVTRPRLELLGTGTLVTDLRHVYSVTARHVVRGQDSIIVGLLQKDGGVKLVTLGIGHMDFVFPASDSVDLAMACLPSNAVDANLAVSVFSKYSSVPPESLAPGLPVLSVGFPLGLGAQTNTPAVKAGIVALVPPGNDSFYIDSNLFPGNSGGPVVTTISQVNLAHESVTITAGESPVLLGIASHTLTYTETAVSAQTRRPRVVFEENSGLAVVVSAARIWRLVEARR